MTIVRQQTYGIDFPHPVDRTIAEGDLVRVISQEWTDEYGNYEGDGWYAVTEVKQDGWVKLSALVPNGVGYGYWMTVDRIVHFNDMDCWD